MNTYFSVWIKWLIRQLIPSGILSLLYLLSNSTDKPVDTLNLNKNLNFFVVIFIYFSFYIAFYFHCNLLIWLSGVEGQVYLILLGYLLILIIVFYLRCVLSNEHLVFGTTFWWNQFTFIFHRRPSCYICASVLSKDMKWKQ